MIFKYDIQCRWLFERRGVQKSLVKYVKCNKFITSRDSGGVITISKVTCPVCKGSGKLPVTREPKAESHGEETVDECPTCQGKGEVDKEE